MKLKIEEVEIEGQKFKIKELDTDSALKLSKIEDKEEIARKTLELSVVEPKMTEEFLKNLPTRIGIQLILKINELNGFGKDFLKVPEILPKKMSGK